MPERQRVPFRVPDHRYDDLGRRVSLARVEPAIHELDPAYLRRHPFTGTCPIASDGQESIYRFRGFVPSIPSCRYDVSGMPAVRITERLLATLKHKPR